MGTVQTSLCQLNNTFQKRYSTLVTLIDRIFCLEVHVTYKKDNIVHDAVCEIINKALHTVGQKFKIDCDLCHGFTCPCQLIKEKHISYIQEDNYNYCCCNKNSSTDLTGSHRVWNKRYKLIICTYSKYYIATVCA